VERSRRAKQRDGVPPRRLPVDISNSFDYRRFNERINEVETIDFPQAEKFCLLKLDITINIQQINFLGFVIGGVLYAMLGVIALPRGARNLSGDYEPDKTKRTTTNFLLISVAVCGCVWNVGELSEIVWRDFFGGQLPLVSAALAYSALGLLPAFIVQLKGQNENANATRKFRFIKLTTYGLSLVAAAMHFSAAAFSSVAPSVAALKLLAIGNLLILGVFLLGRKTNLRRELLGSAALFIFIVSLLHLSFPQIEGRWWLTELVGHQASLPLILAILYQNFRFAFADLFLKRAVSLVLLTTLVLASQFAVAAPLAALHETHPATDSARAGVSLLLWMATALVYPQLYRFSAWLVDTVLLERSNYDALKNEIVRRIAALEPIEAVLTEVKDKLANALDARRSSVTKSTDTPRAAFAGSGATVNLRFDAAEISIPTAEPPHFQIILQDFGGGRKLLSDEITMINDIAWQTARRIDALRVTHERCERELREQEFSNLATEAELRSLRAQLNPHFLFNALTTVGYLTQTAPEKALATIFQLSKLLRGVLRSSGEFQTLGEELNLIESYLEIEKARFEERLNVEIDVPPHLSKIRIPALILQPLIENAVKHGITPKKEGGTIRISAELRGDCLILQIADTGAGINETELQLRRESRVGLNNVEQRLRLHFNRAARLIVQSAPECGTIVRIEINLSAAEASSALSAPPVTKQQARV